MTNEDVNRIVAEIMEQDNYVEIGSIMMVTLGTNMLARGECNLYYAGSPDIKSEFIVAKDGQYGLLREFYRQLRKDLKDNSHGDETDPG